MSSKEIIIENNSLISSSKIWSRKNWQFFLLITANEALSLSEETNPEETDKTMLVALNP